MPVLSRLPDNTESRNCRHGYMPCIISRDVRISLYLYRRAYRRREVETGEWEGKGGDGRPRLTRLEAIYK